MLYGIFIFVCFLLLFIVYFNFFYKEYIHTISQYVKINLDVLEGSEGKSIVLQAQ